nr:immunoglobulin heavy chain junction region [Macaca mulatta]
CTRDSRVFHDFDYW